MATAPATFVTPDMLQPLLPPTCPALPGGKANRPAWKADRRHLYCNVACGQRGDALQQSRRCDGWPDAQCQTLVATHVASRQQAVGRETGSPARLTTRQREKRHVYH